MIRFSSQRFLAIYSGVLTAVFAVTILSGFDSNPNKLRLKELDVQRINVREPDGSPVLQFLNADGKVISYLPAGAK